MSRLTAVAACFTALGVAAASPMPAAAGGSDQTSTQESPEQGSPEQGSAATGDTVGTTDPTMPATKPAGRAGAEERELTLDIARRAIDAFAEVRERYIDDGIENYATLEDFVRETEAGKRLEADIVSYGFSDVTDWRATMVAVGSAYNAVVYDLATDLTQRIEAARDNRRLDAATRAKIIAGLTALMPSPNNIGVLQALVDDPIYSNKLMLLEEEE